MELITSYAVGKTLDYLPPWILRRLTSSQNVAQQIDIDLRREAPIRLELATEIPRIDLYFRITNRSPVDLQLDRLLLEVWIGQPTLHGAILTRHSVPAAQSQDTIHFWDQLTMAQQAQIRRRVHSERVTDPITVEVTAYFVSKIGLISVKRRLEQRDVHCRLPAS